MAKPASPYTAAQLQWATDANFSTGDESGLSTKAQPSAGLLAQGHVPGYGFCAAHDNWHKYGTALWVSYLNNLPAESDFTGQAFAWTVGNHTWTSRARLRFDTPLLHTRAMSALRMAARVFGPTDNMVLANSSNPVYMTGLVNSAVVFIPLNELLRAGQPIDSVECRVKPGAARAGANRMQAFLVTINVNTGAMVDQTSAGFLAAADDGTTADQSLTVGAVTSGDRIVADTFNYEYAILLQLGSTTAAFPDRLYGVRANSYVSVVGDNGNGYSP